MFHYTDKSGWNAIKSQPIWRFKATRPKDPDRPVGAYFTDLEPSKSNLRLLHQKIRVPVVKQEYVFSFLGSEGLVQLNGGTGRDKRIFYSEDDYLVSNEEYPRQLYHGPTSEWTAEDE